MKALEAAKASHAREKTRLNEVLATSIREIMPLVESIKRVNRDLVFHGDKALRTIKLSAKRRHWFRDLLSAKASELLADPVGLNEEDLKMLGAIFEELAPAVDAQSIEDAKKGEFDFLRAMMEETARKAGIELDLSDLDPNGDPEEFERLMRERTGATSRFYEEVTKSAKGSAKPRKPTKAQAEKERKRLEQEEARSRDLKSLFKQLAKAFHPDLEPDPQLKEHKKVWMQRLNTAYATTDLREMLQLEMEWLGEEATNLATAGDQKLQVYCMVLKEQIVDLKRQTHELSELPEYGPLQRFRNPFFGTIANPKSIKKQFQDSLRHHQEMLDTLTANNAESREMIREWADENAYQSSCPF